jgi:Rrf2 family protein
VELAAAGDALVTAEQLAQEQAIPGKVLEAARPELRRAELVRTERGPDGGFTLARPAADISLADIVAAVGVL